MSRVMMHTRREELLRQALELEEIRTAREMDWIDDLPT